MNKELLISILKPVENREVFDEIMSTISDNPKISWYPSAGSDYRDLIFLTKEYFTLRKSLRNKTDSITFPELFIHTDYNSDIEKIENGILHEDKGTLMKITSKVKCALKEGINYDVDSRLVVSSESAFKTPTCYLMNIEVSSKGIGTHNRIVIYFFMENFNFFKEIILKNDLKISHITNIRDGSGCGGGGHINMKFLEFFLGYMKTELFISDNIGRDLVGFDLINNDKVLIEKYNSPLNRPVSFEGLGKIHWSDYGIFLGDSLIFKINHFSEN